MLTDHEELLAAQRALYQLQQTPNWKPIEAWLHGRLARATRVLIEGNDEVVVRRAQGHAQLINEFLRLAAEAEAAVKKQTGAAGKPR